MIWQQRSHAWIANASTLQKHPFNLASVHEEKYPLAIQHSYGK
jgi:hypothetical protein